MKGISASTLRPARVRAVTRRALLFFVLAGSIWPVLSGLAAIPAPQYAPDRILLQPRPGISRQALLDFHARQKAKVLRSFESMGGLQVITVPAGETVPGLVAKYQQSGLVQFVEPDYLVHADLTPNDPAYTNGTTWGIDKIQAPAAWNTRTDATNIVVAVLDTGIRYTHEDLAANMWVNPLDGSHGWNAILGNTNVLDDSNEGHGTQMAGVIGAVGNNGLGLAGVAWRVQLMACKCLNSTNTGTNSDIITCIDYARTNGARVMNASLSVVGGSFSAAMSNAIYAARSAGIIFVTSVGNNYPTVNIDVTPCYPANYQIDNIVAATYTTASDTLGVFANYGATNVDLAAPGEGIYSTYNSADNSYTPIVSVNSGTSFGAAYVSGAFALLLAEFPNENYLQSINRLLSTVDKVSALTGKCRTGGRLNLRKALTPILLTGTPSVGSGPFQLHVSGTTNINCVLQSSPDLNTWSPIYTNNTGLSGSFNFSDPNATNQAKLFYRVVSGQ